MWLLATQLSELKYVRIGQDSCCSSGANGFHTAQLLVDWARDLGIVHTTQSALTALVQYLCYPLFTFVVQLLVLESG